MRARIIRRLRGRRPESGFTLIELVIALLLLAIIMSASLYAILQGLGLSRDSQERVVASDVVTEVLEQLRNMANSSTGFASIPITTESLPAQTIQGTTFHLTQTSEWVNRGVSSSVCNSGTNSSLILRATVTATWGFAGESLSDSTLFAPPNGSFSSGDGALPVQVDSSAGTGYAGATVTATPVNGTPGSPTSITTGSDGCAFFAQLPIGTYDVKVTSPGGVDSAEQAVDDGGDTGVSATENSNFVEGGALSYDTGGTVNWTFAPTSPTPAAGMPISVHPVSALTLTDNMYSYPNTSTTGGGITPLYPDGYELFAGGCTDADPIGEQAYQPFYPSQTANNVELTPGGTTTYTVPLYPLNLSVTTTVAGVTGPLNSGAGANPTATEDPPGLSSGGACPYYAQGVTPVYTLNPVASGSSSTGVGLGLVQINVAIPVVEAGGVHATLHGSVNLWVQPDGVYAVNSSGTPTTEYYSFASGGSVPVAVS